jgi:hypothetical protein
MTSFHIYRGIKNWLSQEQLNKILENNPEMWEQQAMYESSVFNPKKSHLLSEILGG